MKKFLQILFLIIIYTNMYANSTFTYKPFQNDTSNKDTTLITKTNIDNYKTVDSLKSNLPMLFTVNEDTVGGILTMEHLAEIDRNMTLNEVYSKIYGKATIDSLNFKYLMVINNLKDQVSLLNIINNNKEKQIEIKNLEIKNLQAQVKNLLFQNNNYEKIYNNQLEINKQLKKDLRRAKVINIVAYSSTGVAILAVISLSILGSFNN